MRYKNIQNEGGKNILKKRVVIYAVIFILFVAALVVDYNDHDIKETDLEQNLNIELSEITYPEEAVYKVLDQYDKGRVIFYSGQVFNKGNKGPFIYGYRKHWLLPRYDNPTFKLSYSETVISDRGPELETLLFKYTVHQVDDSLSLRVERNVNYKTVLIIGVCLISAFFGWRNRKA